VLDYDLVVLGIAIARRRPGHRHTPWITGDPLRFHVRRALLDRADVTIGEQAIAQA
jgi:hypothetical protein